jgi:Flp pilus assembly protein TadD
VQIDPQHAAASNDLGYGYADKGKNLDRAEQLIRVAVQAEPENQTYLDSLGWVLYKRGRFDQARTALEQSIGNASLPDPTVLDHLGDTLYRLDRKTDAQKEWKQAANRLGVGATTQPADAAAPADDATAAAAAGDDTQQLRLQLRKKLKQLEADQPVSVSPVAAGDSAAAAPKQANTKEK